MSVRAAPSHRRARTGATGGAAGNERLTAMTGAILLGLLAAEGVTILFKRQLLTAHFFIGMMLVGPVLLKMGSTGYRLPRLLGAGSRGRERVAAALAGAGQRWLLLTVALAIGLVVAVATYRLAGVWTGTVAHGGG